MFEWLLLNVISPLLLPVFVLMILVGIAGGRPDAVISLFGSIIVSLIRIFEEVVKTIVSAVLDVLKEAMRAKPRPLPRPKPRPDPTPSPSPAPAPKSDVDIEGYLNSPVDVE